MIPCKLAFIGGGNMARSLIGGLIANGMPAENIHVADKHAATLESLNRQYPVQTFTSNQKAIEGADVIIIAVKPQQLQEVVKALHSSWQEKQLLISIAAGIRIEDISRWQCPIPQRWLKPELPRYLQMNMLTTSSMNWRNPSCVPVVWQSG